MHPTLTDPPYRPHIFAHTPDGFTTSKLLNTLSSFYTEEISKAALLQLGPSSHFRLPSDDTRTNDMTSLSDTHPSREEDGVVHGPLINGFYTEAARGASEGLLALASHKVAKGVPRPAIMLSGAQPDTDRVAPQTSLWPFDRGMILGLGKMSAGVNASKADVEASSEGPSWIVPLTRIPRAPPPSASGSDLSASGIHHPVKDSAMKKWMAALKSQAWI